MGHLCGSQRTPLPLRRDGPKLHKNVDGSSFSTPLRVMEDTSAITAPPPEAHEGSPDRLDRLTSSTALLSSFVVVCNVLHDHRCLRH